MAKDVVALGYSGFLVAVDPVGLGMVTPCEQESTGGLP